MPIESGYLTSLEVEYVRTARYSVLYQLDGLPVRRVTITAHPRIGLVGRVRESEPGDSVSITTSEDGRRLIDWNNMEPSQVRFLYNSPEHWPALHV